MSFTLTELPDDVNALQRLLVEREKRYTSEKALLEEQILLLKSQLFGRKSERTPEDIRQARLFDEIESEHSRGPDLFATVREQVEVPTHLRNKPKRESFPAHVPRREIVHDIPEHEKLCACGATLQTIGAETSEKLGMIPAELYVERHVRLKYACKACQGLSDESQPTVRIAALPPAMIPKSFATPELLAYLLTGKFVDGLPFYRLEKIFARLGIDYPRVTMCGHALQVHERCRRLLELLQENLLRGPLIGCDETHLQVLNEPGRSNTTTSYMWVLRGGTKEKPILLFLYRATRSANFLRDLLHGFSGTLQTDGFSSYDTLCRVLRDVRHAGCMAHARRKFTDIFKIDPNSPSAHYMVGLFGQLYKIEAEARERDMTAREIRRLRQRCSLPILHEMRRWLDEAQPKAPPDSALGKAIHYTLNAWDTLLVYVDDGHVPIDNNLVENAIRPFVLGRKNWLFSGSPDGAHASAALFSLVENAKANGLEPYQYLRHLFTYLPLATADDDLRALLPQNIDPQLLQPSR